MKYLYRKGSILVTTWERHKLGGECSNAGVICKVLARPGQIVYDPETEEPYELGEGKYVIYYNELGINQADYIATLHHGMLPLFPGILVDEIHLRPATNYEKTLRRKGITKSPYHYNSEEPEGQIAEVVAFKYFGKLRLLEIKRIYNSAIPLFELSNGDVIERGSLKLFYRKATEYEKEIFTQQKKTNQSRSRVFATC
jgi:hypothetical protein